MVSTCRQGSKKSALIYNVQSQYVLEYLLDQSSNVIGHVKLCEPRFLNPDGRDKYHIDNMILYPVDPFYFKIAVANCIVP